MMSAGTSICRENGPTPVFASHSAGSGRPWHLGWSFFFVRLESPFFSRSTASTASGYRGSLGYWFYLYSDFGLTIVDGAVYNVTVQQLASESISQNSPEACAELLLGVTPQVMRRIRGEMRLRTLPGLSIPQFRALDYLSLHPQVSLNVLAERLGLTPPTASKLIQKLVCNKVVARRVASDRRRVSLSLTPSGTSALAMARSETRQQLADSLKSLSPKELDALSVALRALERAFSQGGNDVNVP